MKTKTPVRAGHRPRVLLVEDVREEVDSIKEQLETEGFDVLVADDSRKAVRALKASYFAAIVLDYRIPPYSRPNEEEAGGKLVREARQRDAFVPIILLSAVVKVDQEGALVRDGITFILRKGGDPVALPKLLHDSLERSEFIGATLAEWLKGHPGGTRPVLIGTDGRSYSLKEALDEIKRDTPNGKHLRELVLRGLLEIYARK